MNSQIFVPWHDFYMLLGQASATMTGLLFVAASIGSGVFTTRRPGALRMFLSASVVQFGAVLTICLVALSPWHGEAAVGAASCGCGAFGLVYSALAWRDTVRDGIFPRIDLEDRLWYAAAPAVCYAMEVGAGVALLRRMDAGGEALAFAVVAHVLIAIHNAWDITIWSVTRRKDDEPRE